MKKILFTFLLASLLSYAHGQTLNVLFLGNSYTSYNNLPQMVADMATSTNDTLNFDSNLMGGATFSAHSLHPVSLNKIMAGNWDYVVLQGQSLEMWGNPPNILTSYFMVVTLDSLINVHSPCGETMFYRTWGRKNGFGATPYHELDSIIHSNYMKLADSLDAVVSPVGEVWKYIRQHHPNIELYAPDESHPSLAGTYAAACTFYAALFRKDPTQVTFNSTLAPSVTSDIKQAAKLIVYDSLLNWHITEYDSIIAANCASLGTGELNDHGFVVFPNPVSRDELYIKITDPRSSSLRAEITRSTGQRVISKLIGHPGPVHTIDISGLRPGLYFCTISSDEYTRTVKFIVH